MFLAWKPTKILPSVGEKFDLAENFANLNGNGNFLRNTLGIWLAYLHFTVTCITRYVDQGWASFSFRGLYLQFKNMKGYNHLIVGVMQR